MSKYTAALLSASATVTSPSTKTQRGLTAFIQRQRLVYAGPISAWSQLRVMRHRVAGVAFGGRAKFF